MEYPSLSSNSLAPLVDDGEKAFSPRELGGTVETVSSSPQKKNLNSEGLQTMSQQSSQQKFSESEKSVMMLTAAQEKKLASSQSSSSSGRAALNSSLSGFLGGAASTILLHPLDLIKVRLQIKESNYSSMSSPSSSPASRNPGMASKRIPPTTSISSHISHIVRSEGGYRGLYRGLSANFAGSTLSWGLYFFLYSKIKNLMASNCTSTGRLKQHLSPFQHLSASATAGALTSLVANPLFVIKTRMFTQAYGDPLRYRGLLHGLSSVYKGEGVAGLYRGMVPALFGVSHGAVQFMGYERLKIWRVEYFGPSSAKNTPLASLEYIGMAAASKLFAVLVTYPYQVVKSRMQTEDRVFASSTSPNGNIGEGRYAGVGKTLKTIYTNEGLPGFYKGMRVNLIRVLPGTCITFGVYEMSMHQLTSHN